MVRYYVIDTSCAEYEDVVLLEYRGELLGIFNKLDTARALAEQRTAAGAANIVIVDSVEGKQVYACPQRAADEGAPPVSHKRPRSTPPHPQTRRRRRRTAG
jgi:hypothetical protein